MPAKGSGKIAKLPQVVRDEITGLRSQGKGPDGIYRAMKATCDEYAISLDMIRAFIYRPQGQATERLHDRLGKISDLLSRSGIEPEDIGKVERVRISEWQGMTKNADGEAEIHDLSGASILLAPSWDEGPAWPVIDRGPAVKVPKPPAPKKNADGWRRAVIIPDPQIGYRRDLDTAELDPFHDEAAMAAALRVVRAVDPDDVIVLGDFLDLAPLSRFEQEPGFALTMQPAIDRATLFLAELVAAAPRSDRRVLIEGNHDRRLSKSVTANAIAAFGLRPGFTPPDTWPDLSVPHLLRVDELGFDYVGGYPAGVFWINERLAAIHGHKVASTGSTAARVVDDERVSVIFGHVHRVEMAHRTRRTFHGPRHSVAVSAGCLCRIDGAVPSTKGSTDVFGRAVPTVENWTQGVVVVTYQEGDGPFSIELVPIFDGQVMLRGTELVAV